MISLLDIIEAIKQKLENSFQDAEIYISNLEEGFKKPSFLFAYHNLDNKSSNYYLVNKKLDMQIIYYAKEKQSGKGDGLDRLGAMEKLDNIFGTLNLQVKNRNLSFQYSYGEADGHLTIELYFEYADDKPTQEEERETIQKIIMNESEV